MSAKRYMYQPQKGDVLQKACPPGTKVFRYRDLFDPNLMLGRDNVILLEDPMKPNTGHWVALKLMPEYRQAYFFNSYGGKPDQKKNEWIPLELLQASGQDENVLNDILKGLALKGWTIHYNDYAYQKEGDKTATCGVWAAAFLNSEQNPDVFKEKHFPLEAYYEALFRKHHW
ncbi:TPA_asm: adenain [Sheep rumen MELD virus]|nr:TPA_asm: adenain [Sheep rumen MELD virus]